MVYLLGQCTAFLVRHNGILGAKLATGNTVLAKHHVRIAGEILIDKSFSVRCFDFGQFVPRHTIVFTTRLFLHHENYIGNGFRSGILFESGFG